jgi:hypothetical protein
MVHIRRGWVVTHSLAMARSQLMFLVLAHNVWCLSSTMDIDDGIKQVKFVKSAMHDALQEPSLQSRERLHEQRTKDKYLPCLLRRCRPILRAGQLDLRQMIESAKENVTACNLCGAVPMHRCGCCGRSTISHGVASQEDGNRYVYGILLLDMFFLRLCALRMRACDTSVHGYNSRKHT